MGEGSDGRDLAARGWLRSVPSTSLPAAAVGDHPIVRATVGDHDVLLLRLADGEVVAFDVRCPHQATALDDATVWDGNVRCPHHLYIYDPRTGENLVPKADARRENLWKLKPGYLKVFGVEERDGWVWVDPEPKPPPPGYDPEIERRPPGATRSASPPPPPSTAAGPVEHASKTVLVTVGKTFEIRLPVPGRPGHVWRAEVTGGPLLVVEDRFEASTPPVHRVRVAARGVGSGSLRCSYGQPWSPVPAEVRTYVVRVEPVSD